VGRFRLEVVGVLYDADAAANEETAVR